MVKPSVREQLQAPVHRSVRRWPFQAPRFQARCRSKRVGVVHEVEVDFGDLQDEILKGLRDNFEQVRAPVIRAGMDRTIQNLRTMAAR